MHKCLHKQLNILKIINTIYWQKNIHYTVCHIRVPHRFESVGLHQVRHLHPHLGHEVILGARVVHLEVEREAGRLLQSIVLFTTVELSVNDFWRHHTTRCTTVYRLSSTGRQLHIYLPHFVIVEMADTAHRERSDVKFKTDVTVLTSGVEQCLEKPHS